MKNWMVVLATVGIVLHAAAAITDAKPMAQRTTLGVPSYPGWTTYRLDDQADAWGQTRLYQYQYHSNDSGRQIVGFYEQHLNTTAAFTEPTHTYTINSPDGTMIQITAPPDGVPHVVDDGQPTGNTWTSLITIIRAQ